MTGMKQVYRTYGRHRQRVISVDLWSLKDNHEVFSFSSEAHNGTNRTSDDIASSGQDPGKRKKTTTRQSKTNRRQLRRRHKEICYGNHFQTSETSANSLNSANPSISDAEEWKSQNMLLNHDTTSISPVRQKKVAKKKPKRQLSGIASVRHKQTLPRLTRDKNYKKAHIAKADNMEYLWNFSQFDSYNLVLDSSLYTATDESGSTKQKTVDASPSVKLALHSTPHPDTNHHVQDKSVINLDNLSGVSDISYNENSDPSSYFDDRAVRTGLRQNCTVESESEVELINSENAAGQSEEIHSDADGSIDSFVNAHSHFETRKPDLSYDTKKYNASESLFDHSFVVGNEQDSCVMTMKNARRAAVSVSFTGQLEKSKLDLREKCNTHLVGAGNERTFSSDQTHSSADLSYFSQQNLYSLNTCADDIHNKVKSYATSQCVKLGTSKRTVHNHCHQNVQMSSERHKQLIEEIHHSAKHLQVSLTRLALPTPAELETSAKIQPPKMYYTPGKLRTPGRLQTPPRKVINDQLSQTPHMLLDKENKLAEEISRSKHSLQVLLTPLRSPAVITARDKVLFLCQQSKPIPFLQCIPSKVMQKCRKVGEGVYGEVFASKRSRKQIALKILPIEGDALVNGEQQKTFEEVLPEIIITKELSALNVASDCQTPNFVEMKRVSVVCGTYPTALLKQWDIFDAEKGSENDRPDFYDGNQLFLVFEFTNCGVDLASFELSNMQQVKSVLQQVVASLAVAEEALEFEHRDLHWGNVLLKPTKCKRFNYRLQGKSFSFESHGIKVAIIDFTLSRLRKDGCNIYTDLSNDLTLFEGHGDYQFDVYRLMKETNRNNWETFHPFTNILWIKYLTDKLLNHKSHFQKNGKQAQGIFKQLEMHFHEVLNYMDARHLFMESPCFQGLL